MELFRLYTLMMPANAYQECCLCLVCMWRCLQPIRTELGIYIAVSMWTAHHTDCEIDLMYPASGDCVLSSKTKWCDERGGDEAVNRQMNVCITTWRVWKRMDTSSDSLLHAWTSNHTPFYCCECWTVMLMNYNFLSTLSRVIETQAQCTGSGNRNCCAKWTIIHVYGIYSSQPNLFKTSVYQRKNRSDLDDFELAPTAHSFNSTFQVFKLSEKFIFFKRWRRSLWAKFKSRKQVTNFFCGKNGEKTFNHLVFFFRFR